VYCTRGSQGEHIAHDAAFAEIDTLGHERAFSSEDEIIWIDPLNVRNRRTYRDRWFSRFRELEAAVPICRPRQVEKAPTIWKKPGPADRYLACGCVGCEFPRW
jgi:hypothetical protein